MLFYLSEWLREYLGFLNVARYVTFRVMAAFVTSLVICLVLFPWLIERLKSLQMGQVIRAEMPANHHAKAGIPTLGGLLVMVSIQISSLLWCQISNRLVLLTLGVGFFFAVVGFIDDARKLRERHSRGLPGRIRLALEFLVTGVLLWGLLAWWGKDYSYDLRLYLPFVSAERFWWNLPIWLYFLLGLLVIVGTANAVNLTDGLDGLAAGPILTASAVFLILAYLTGAKLGSLDLSRYLLIPKVVGAQELSIVASAIMGATIGFLFYNTYPAEIFMGDTGALGLGAMLGAMAVLTKNELLSMVIFGVFLFEAISVILQTTSFKLTGKRVLPMAPLHHSFEKIGWKEPKIVVRFWIASLLLAMVALASIKVR
ncbi:MAG TPA: phospho-N-acetylmuramoyl-pentapeptide-transferase [Myxococcota bacterium]|nr:phospho-N-acetylmuramoyl-pentapeptide-transferase [Myxococcota bacterium]HQK49611.1 phospho-N-acetylmuramoyl-pentapeptide-transferase [Myxococcota bacterium]